eukprot:270146-Ditylum_brightwellii.AAC.1
MSCGDMDGILTYTGRNSTVSPNHSLFVAGPRLGLESTHPTAIDLEVSSMQGPVCPQLASQTGIKPMQLAQQSLASFYLH